MLNIYFIFVESHLRSDGQKDCLSDHVHQGGEHPLLVLKLLKHLKPLPQLVTHQEVAKHCQADVMSHTPNQSCSRIFREQVG